MLRREITVDGKPYQIEIAECPIGSPFSIRINNRLREITLKQEPADTKTFSIKVNGKSYHVELPSLERNTPFSIKVNNIPFKAELKSTTLTPRIAVAAPSPASMLAPKPTKALGEGVVAAPMAGKIISVRVRKGDSVKMGSVLCVLEAMKMENEITAPKSGIVGDVKAQEGKAVNEGDILIQIE